MLIGLHIETSTDYRKSLEDFEAKGGSVAQFFTGNPHSYFPRSFTGAYLGNLKCVAHATFVINFADPVYGKTVEGAIKQAEWAAAIGADYIIFHAGSAKQKTHKEVLPTYHKSLDRLLAHTEGKITVLLENTAQARKWNTTSSLGAMRTLAEITKEYPTDLIGICMDSAHAFAADEPIDEICAAGPSPRIPVVHANVANKNVTRGSRIDRHDAVWGGAYSPTVLANWLVDLQPRYAIAEIKDATLGEVAQLKTAVKLAAHKKGVPDPCAVETFCGCGGGECGCGNGNSKLITTSVPLSSIKVI